MPSKQEIRKELLKREIQKRGLNQKIQGTYSEQLPQQGISADSFQKMEPGQEPYEYVGGQIEGDDTEGFLDKTWNAIGAHTQAGYAGIMVLGSSLAKAADAIGLAPEGTAERAQKSYEEAEELYQQGEVPGTGVTKFAAELGTMVAGGKGLSKLIPTGLLGKTGQATANMASKIPGGQKAANAASRITSPKTIKGGYAQSAAKNAAIGGTALGLMNTPGQSPEDVFNEQSAAIGAGLGGAIGIPAKFISRYGKDAAAYQKALQEADDIGYRGPVVAQDFGDKAVKDIKQAWMNNIIDNTLREEQLDAVSDAAKALGQKLLGVSEKHGVGRLGQVVRGINNRMQRTSNEMHREVFNQAKKQGITKATPNKSKETAKELLKEHPGLPKTLKKTLEPLSQAKKVNIETLNQIKGKDIWSYAEKYAKAGDSDVVSADIAKNLRKMYWDITDDIGSAFNKDPKLSSSWEAAKQYTKGYKSIFNSKKNRKLVNAVEDINDTADGLKTFYNHLTKSSSDKAIKYYQKNLGPSFTKVSKHASLRRALNDSFSTEAKGLNLPKFFKDVKELGTDLIDEKSMKSLDGLNKVFNRAQEAQKIARQANAPQRIKYSMPQLQLAAVGTGYYAGGIQGASMAAGAVYGGPALLKYVSRSSPMKNLLIGLSNVWKKNPKTADYITEKISKHLSKAGVILRHNNDDSMTIDLEKNDE